MEEWVWINLTRFGDEYKFWVMKKKMIWVDIKWIYVKIYVWCDVYERLKKYFFK